jgi:GMT-like protein
VTLPPTFSVDVECGTAVENITPLLDGLATDKLTPAPTFAFLDPFGVSQVPMDLVARLMSNARCEVLITFMFEEINRFVDHPDMRAHLDALFGGPEWRAVLELPVGPQRRAFLRECYQRQLTAAAGIRFVRWFEMRNKRNATDYFMFFGTNNVLGLEKMKEAMWKADPTGAFQFSDATDPAQLTLLGKGPDVGQVRAFLRARFAGQTVPVEAIKQFIIEETPFCASHYKKVLKAMEHATPSELCVVQAPPKRNRGTFPDGVVVQFT